MPFTVSVNPYTDTIIIKIWFTDCHFELKLPNAFSVFHPAANTYQLKCLYRLLVVWQYGTQELVFGKIITDPELWSLRLNWRDYHSIIAQRTPYKSHNAKRAWLVWFLTSSCNGSIEWLFKISSNSQQYRWWFPECITSSVDLQCPPPLFN